MLAAATLVGLVGCAVDDDPAPITSARSEEPLTAAEPAALGQFRVDDTGHVDVTLANGGRKEIIIRKISLIPPDPYAPEFVPPDPCYPPDPYHNPPGDVPPDPYHNPPTYHAPETYVTTRLLAPCVKPGGATTLEVGFSAIDAGGFAAGIQIEYATADGEAFTLTVPTTACAIR